MSQGKKKCEKTNSLGKVRKNLPVGRMHSFRFQTLPHLDSLMFHLPSSPSFLIFILFPFLPLPSGPPFPAHMHQLSSFAFALLFNHISLTNLTNHLEWMRTVWKAQKALGVVWAMVAAWVCFKLPINTKNNHPKNRILKWKAVNSRPLSPFCQVYWFADCGAVKAL